MKGYENVDEKELLGLFHDKGSLTAMPLLKDDKVFATDCHKVIYINAEVCQGEYERTEKFDKCTEQKMYHFIPDVLRCQ